MTLLCSIMEKYGSDKGAVTQIKQHNFSEFYHSLFGPIREGIHDVLEVGILHGASLRAWAEYFPFAMIHGADIDLGPSNHIKHDRIWRHQLDTTDPAALKDFATGFGKLDIIIDDGLHTEKNNLETFDVLFPLLHKGGYYIIEDVFYPSSFGWRVELSHLENGYDNNLIVVRK